MGLKIRFALRLRECSKGIVAPKQDAIAPYRFDCGLINVAWVQQWNRSGVEIYIAVAPQLGQLHHPSEMGKDESGFRVAFCQRL